MNAAADCTRDRREYVGMAITATAFIKGISAIVGPSVSGLLLEAGHGTGMGSGFGQFGFGAVELFVGSCALASAVGSVVVAILRRRVAT